MIGLLVATAIHFAPANCWYDSDDVKQCSPSYHSCDVGPNGSSGSCDSDDDDD